MTAIPSDGGTPLIRTDFSYEAAWDRLISAASAASSDGFTPNLNIISDKGFDGTSAEELGQSARHTDHAILLIADQTTLLGGELPILCVDISDPRKQFRVVPAELWGVENNLTLANMDFDEFAEAVGSDGIFRGF